MLDVAAEPGHLTKLQIPEYVLCWRAGCRENCPSGWERAGRKRTPARVQRAALPLYATQLLNAGAPALSVQSLLGHEKLDTTLGYARLYDGTIAADYYRAMSQVEQLFHLPESRPVPFYTPAELVALVDSLGSGTLNEKQRETVQALREGILTLASKEEVKV